MKTIVMFAALLPVAAAAQIPSTPSLGIAEGRCRPGEAGPAFLINATGLKDRKGTLKVELYAANDEDFLADDNKLIAAGKAFRRAVVDLPATGPAQLCIRAPGAGQWALALLHDRDSNRKFSLFSDGVGFPGNPTRLTRAKPTVETGRAVAGAGPTTINVRLLYLSGFGFSPLRER